MSKKHYKDMADRLGKIRFNNREKTSVNRNDIHIEYENAISDFFKSFSKSYNEDIFFDAILMARLKRKSEANDERIRKHVKAEEMLSKSQFGIVNK